MRAGSVSHCALLLICAHHIQPVVCSLYVLLLHRCDNELGNHHSGGGDFDAGNKGLTK